MEENKNKEQNAEANQTESTKTQENQKPTPEPEKNNNTTTPPSPQKTNKKSGWKKWVGIGCAAIILIGLLIGGGCAILGKKLYNEVDQVISYASDLGDVYILIDEGNTEVEKGNDILKTNPTFGSNKADEMKENFESGQDKYEEALDKLDSIDNSEALDNQELKKVHEMIKDGLKEYKSGLATIIKGINQENNNTINKGVDQYEEGTDLLEKANDMFDQAQQY